MSQSIYSAQTLPCEGASKIISNLLFFYQPEIRNVLVCQGHRAVSMQCQLLSFSRNAQLGRSSCFPALCVATALERHQIAAVSLDHYYF